MDIVNTKSVPGASSCIFSYKSLTWLQGFPWSLLDRLFQSDKTDRARILKLYKHKAWDFFNPHWSFFKIFFNLFIEHCIPSNTSISKPEIKSSPIRLMTMFECWTARLMLSSSASSKGQKRTWPRSPTTCKVVVGVIGAHLRLW